MAKGISNKNRKYRNISNRKRKRNKDMWIKLKRIKNKEEQLERFGKLYNFDTYLQEQG